MSFSPAFPGPPNSNLGYHKTSVAYLSPGHRRMNQPFSPTLSYGPPIVRGDVVGVGYRPRTGTVFFTRNGKKLDDVTHTFKTQNLFPTVGATGAATIHVNFGQMAYVYIEANVKKWGLAPMTGSLAPPPPYGSEQGSILLDQGQHGVAEGHGAVFGPNSWGGGARHARSRSAQVRLSRGQLHRSPGPQRSPTDISLAEFGENEDGDSDEDENDGEEGPSYRSHGQPSAGGVEDVPNFAAGEGLGLLDAGNPPPEYSSPLQQSPISARLTRGGREPRDDYFDHSSDDDENHRSGYGEQDDASSTPRPNTAVQRNPTRGAQQDPERSPPIPYDVAVASRPSVTHLND